MKTITLEELKAVGEVCPDTLIHGECLEAMQYIRSGSIDMILADLPYGVTQNKWDSIIPLDKLWAQYKRICRGTVVLTAVNKFTIILGNSNLEDFKYSWVWEKTKATGHLNAKRQPMRAHEDVLIFGNGIYNPQKVNGGKPASNSKGASKLDTYGNFGEQRTNNTDGFRFPRTVLKINNAEFEDKNTLHPTQKPIALMEYLIKTYTNEDMIVLDNCMGSGTTGVACLNTNRRFIGMELDETYFNIAKERIDKVWESTSPQVVLRDIR